MSILVALREGDKVAFLFHKSEQVCCTPEYAYDDFLVGSMAQALGDSADAKFFLKRFENWRKVINKETGFVRERYASGVCHNITEVCRSNTSSSFR